MAKRIATAIALVLGLLAFLPGAPGQLPPAVQPDRLQVQAEREVQGEVMNCMGGPAQDWHKDWYAWNNLQPPGPGLFLVTAEVLVHNAGVEAMLALRPQQSPQEAVISLDLLCSEKPVVAAQVETWVSVRYEMQIPENLAGGYSQAIIFHKGRELVTLDTEDAH